MMEHFPEFRRESIDTLASTLKALGEAFEEVVEEIPDVEE